MITRTANPIEDFIVRDTSFLAKLLGLTGSSNAGEREVAERKLHEQLAKRNMTMQDLERNLAMDSYDPENDKAVHWLYVDSKGRTKNTRLDPATVIIVQAVADYFNGQVLTGQGEIDVFATKGNKIQIILYCEYLLDQLLVDLKKAKKDQEKGDRCFNYIFRKGWAYTVSKRLSEMKQVDNEVGRTINNTHISALALQDKNKKEYQASLALQKQMYPRTGTSSGYGGVYGNAAQAGVNAGSNVGLNRQVSGRAAYRLGGS